MKRRSQKTPESLKQVEKKLRGLRKSRAYKVNLFGVRRRLKAMNKAGDSSSATADQWVDTHREDWIAKAKGSHDGVLEDLHLLEIRVDEVQAGYEVELEHHREVVVGYLRAAVTHAWDRISDPESPYYDPRVRRRHGDLS